MQDRRHVLVPPERLEGWVRRFAERNGATSAEVGGAVVVLRAANGCAAELTTPARALDSPAPASPVPGMPAVPPEAAVEALVRAASLSTTVGLLLVRRGGYAVGVSRDGELLSSRTGTRYVQSRTAAGGWSQQRFARRRANQASVLVEAAAQQAESIFAGHRLDSIQPGGDSQLVSECLTHPALVRYRALPELPLLPVPDPRLDVLRRAAADARAVRVLITGIPGA